MQHFTFRFLYARKITIFLLFTLILRKPKRHYAIKRLNLITFCTHVNILFFM